MSRYYFDFPVNLTNEGAQVVYASNSDVTLMDSHININGAPNPVGGVIVIGVNATKIINCDFTLKGNGNAFSTMAMVLKIFVTTQVHHRDGIRKTE